MRLLRAELLKLRTTPRTVVGLILPLLAIVVLGAVGNITGEHEASTVVSDILDVAGFANVIAIVLGVLIVTWEFRHDTIAGTFMVEPRRERVDRGEDGGGHPHGRRCSQSSRLPLRCRSPTSGSAATRASRSTSGAAPPASSPAPRSGARSASAWARSCAGRPSRSCSRSSGS